MFQSDTVKEVGMAQTQNVKGLEREKLAILGATGSVGGSTLKVIEEHFDRYEVTALVAGTQIDQLIHLCETFQPKVAILGAIDSISLEQKYQIEVGLQKLRALGIMTELEFGCDSICRWVASDEIDTVVAAITGFAGLKPTYTAVEAGKKVLLANKEALVVAGDLVMQKAAETGAAILPLDSEHNAILQCLPDYLRGEKMLRTYGVSEVILTASGGPFLKLSSDELKQVTIEQALKHPNWSMGKKITIDSATLMNKGLEYIEACHLFGLAHDQIDVVVHPQSIIHSLVRYVDNSFIAQMGVPDMRIPIAYALAWPERISVSTEPLSFTKLNQLTFEEPDESRFICLRLAKDAMREGGTAPAILNAVNEVTVEAFLQGKIRFDQISLINQRVLEASEVVAVGSLSQLYEQDRSARQRAARLVDECLP